MEENSNVVPHQYLIAFQKDMNDESCRKFLANLNVKVLEKVGSSPLYLIEIQNKSELVPLRAHEEVRYVEPNIRMKTF